MISFSTGKLRIKTFLEVYFLLTAQTEKNRGVHWGKQDSLFGGLIP